MYFKNNIVVSFSNILQLYTTIFFFKVNIVFHAAATVRFDEKLDIAITLNVKAPLFLIELAHQMKELKCFLHISTAYTNCVQPLIEEKVYPPPMDHEELIKITDNVPSNLICCMTNE